MASVTSCKLKSRQASYQIRNQTTGRFEYFVETDSDALVDEVLNGAQTITGTGMDPVPYLWSANGPNYVTSIDVSQRQRDNATKWLVTVTVGPVSPGSTVSTPQSGFEENPLDRPSERWTELINERRPIQIDANGNPILNSAGDPFPDPVEIDDWIVVFVVSKNYASYTDILQLNLSYFNTTNSTQLYLDGNEVEGDPTPNVFYFAAGQLRFGGVESSPPRYEANTTFWTGQTRLFYKPTGWKAIKENVGYRFLNPNTTKKENVLDYTGQQTMSVVRLDDDGNVEDAAVAQSFEEFDVLIGADFGPLLTG